MIRELVHLFLFIPRKQCSTLSPHLKGPLQGGFPPGRVLTWEPRPCCPVVRVISESVFPSGVPLHFPEGQGLSPRPLPPAAWLVAAQACFC